MNDLELKKALFEKTPSTFVLRDNYNYKLNDLDLSMNDILEKIDQFDSKYISELYVNERKGDDRKEGDRKGDDRKGDDRKEGDREDTIKDLTIQFTRNVAKDCIKIERDTTGKEEERKYLFLVSSCIHTSLFPMFNTSKRSVYTHKERFEQTIETCKSIRRNVRNAYIVICESNVLFGNEIAELHKYCDFIYIPEEYDRILWYEHRNKGFCEVSSMYKALNTVMTGRDRGEIKNTKFEYVLKISGRYQILDGFNIEKFVTSDKITIKETTNDDYKKPFHGVCLIMYSVPIQLLDYFKSRMLYAIKQLNRNTNIPLENILFEQESILYHYNKDVNTLVFIDRITKEF